MALQELTRTKRIVQEGTPISAKEKQKEILSVEDKRRAAELLSVLLVSMEAAKIAEKTCSDKRVRRFRCMMLACSNAVWYHLPKEGQHQHKKEEILAWFEKNASRSGGLCVRGLLFVCSERINRAESQVKNKHIEHHLKSIGRIIQKMITILPKEGNLRSSKTNAGGHESTF